MHIDLTMHINANRQVTISVSLNQLIASADEYITNFVSCSAILSADVKSRAISAESHETRLPKTQKCIRNGLLIWRLSCPSDQSELALRQALGGMM